MARKQDVVYVRKISEWALSRGDLTVVILEGGLEAEGAPERIWVEVRDDEGNIEVDTEVQE